MGYMTEKLSDNQIEIIRLGHKVGNGPGAFFLRPILKTVFGCVWSRDRQNWFARSQPEAERISKICSELERLLDEQLNAEEKILADSILPNRDK